MGFAQVGAESGWRTANTKNIQETAEAEGIDLKFSDAQQKQENQIKAIRSYIQQKVDIIAFSPVVETGWDAVLQEAKRAKIPVILTDRAVDTDDTSLYVTFLGSDFIEEGEKAGQWLVDNADTADGDGDGDIDVVELQGTTGAAPAIDRKEGFESVIGDNPDISIVASQTGDFTRDGGKQVMEAFLQSEDGIDVVYAHNDDMGLGAIEAIKAAGLTPGKDIKIITVDAVKDGMTALSKGEINFIVECNPLLGPQLMDLATAGARRRGGPRPGRHRGGHLHARAGRRGPGLAPVLRRTPTSPAAAAGSDRNPTGRARPRRSPGPPGDLMTPTQMTQTEVQSPVSTADVNNPDMSTTPDPAARARARDRDARHLHHLRCRPGPRPRSASVSTPARCTPSWARTAPASPRSSRRSPASTASTPAPSSSTAREVEFATPAAAQAAGISTVYQEVNLVPNLSVAENMMLGREPRRFGLPDRRAMVRRAREVLERLGLDVDPRSQLGEHPIAVQQLVAIARSVDVDARVVILDEPTSSLDADEVEKLFDVMRRLRDQGTAIVFVSHFLDQVYEIADRMTVLRNGRLVEERMVADTTQLDLVKLMIGRELEVLDRLDRESSGTTARREGEPVLKALGLGRKGSLQATDLEVYEGEVIGVAGLLGSGRTELARLLFGADTADTGQLAVRSSKRRMRSPRHAIDRKIAFSSEDRKAEGVVEDLTVADNMLLALQASRGWLRPIPTETRTRLVQEYIAALDIRPADPTALMRNLSGGNQQKVLLARWLITQPELLILDEPTRGIDIGAKAQIQALVADLAAKGMSVVFISSELEEVLRLSDRLVVMRDRRKIDERVNDDVSVSDVLEIIAGEARSDAGTPAPAEEAPRG